MLDIKELNRCWQVCVEEIHADVAGKKSPRQTVKNIIDLLGEDNAKETFATIAQIKKHDGRIYPAEHEWAKNYPVNPENVEKYYNVRGLDAVHPAHIAQLLEEIRTM